MYVIAVQCMYSVVFFFPLIINFKFNLSLVKLIQLNTRAFCAQFSLSIIMSVKLFSLFSSWSIIPTILSLSSLWIFFSDFEYLSTSHAVFSFIYYTLHSHCIKHGRLRIVDRSMCLDEIHKLRDEIHPCAHVHEFGDHDHGSDDIATIYINSDRMFQNVLSKGDVGLGESYVLREWETDDLDCYLRLLFSNWNHFQYYLSILDWVSLPMWNEFLRIYSYKSHSIEDDKHYITYHYDTGTQLFKLFLDPQTMVYTSAIFNTSILSKFINLDEDKNKDKDKDENTNPELLKFPYGLSDIETQHLLSMGQTNKIARMAAKANIKKNDKILDIGCGFGHLASWMAQNTDISHVTGITISQDQYDYALEKYSNVYTHVKNTTQATSDMHTTKQTNTQYNEAGQNNQVQAECDETLTHNDSQRTRVEFVMSDYRLFGTSTTTITADDDLFDAIFSVEMIEAIGRSQVDAFFDKVSSFLKPGKRFVIQFISYTPWKMPASYSAKDGSIPTFVGKYIFPSSFIPDASFIHEMAHKNGFELIHSESFGKHYALTLTLWRKRLNFNKDKIIQLFDENTFYTFDYYLAWCAAACRNDVINDWQFVLQKRSHVNQPNPLAHIVVDF